MRVKIFGPTKSLSEMQDRENKRFELELETLLEGYQYLKGSNVTQLSVALVYNKKPITPNAQDYGNNLFFYTVNFPRFIEPSEQDIKNSVFRARLDRVLKGYRFFPEGGIYSLIVALYYNKNIDEIEIQSEGKTVCRKTPRSSEEGLVYFSVRKPKFTIKQVVLSQDIRNEIDQTLAILRYRHILYEDWGFREVEPEPKAILNFYGPPGTGKTMTAHAIAHSLGRQILALNYADIESKFVGDAPKNLVRAFDTASKEDALLFFDEADSFLGKRISNVTSSSDQAVNSLRSQMLILLENFNGVIIFATNLLRNYDRAFESRIFKHIKFELPDDKARKKIIRKTIPSKVPFEGGKKISLDELDVLAELSQGFAGREIKNAVLGALTYAVTRNQSFVKFENFFQSFNSLRSERKKLESEYYIDSGTYSKKQLEEKIKENLSLSRASDEANSGRTFAEQCFYKALVDIAVLAAFSDGVVQPEEQMVLEKTAQALGLAEYEFPSQPEQLPLVSDLIVALDSHEKKMRVLDFVLHVIAADGRCVEEERKFLQQLCSSLGFSNNEDIARVLALADALAMKEAEWKELQSSLMKLQE